MSETGTLISHNGKITREELAHVPTPAATATHRPVAHHEIVAALVETLTFRQIGVIQEEYAVSHDGMKMFGVLDLAIGFNGCRFSIGIRNSHDKSSVWLLPQDFVSWSVKIWPSAAISRQCSRNTQSISHYRIALRPVWTDCREISSRCAAKWRLGANSSLRPRRRS